MRLSQTQLLSISFIKAYGSHESGSPFEPPAIAVPCITWSAIHCCPCSSQEGAGVNAEKRFSSGDQPFKWTKIKLCSHIVGKLHGGTGLKSARQQWMKSEKKIHSTTPTDRACCRLSKSGPLNGLNIELHSDAEIRCRFRNQKPAPNRWCVNPPEERLNLVIHFRWKIRFYIFSKIHLTYLSSTTTSKRSSPTQKF